MTWMWFITALSLVGVVLNIYKRSECFAIWAVTNTAWMVYDYRLGAHSQAALFAMYLILALWGLWKWSREKAVRRPDSIERVSLMMEIPCVEIDKTETGK